MFRESAGKHPPQLHGCYVPVKGQERAWPTSVEKRYKLTKTKVAVKVYQNPDLFMRAVQMFDEKAAEKWRSMLVTEAHKFAGEQLCSVME